MQPMTMVCTITCQMERRASNPLNMARCKENKRRTQTCGINAKCIEAIMATGVYKNGPIGEENLEHKMREHVGYIRSRYGPGKPHPIIQLAMNKGKSHRRRWSKQKNKGKNIVKNSALIS